MAVWRVRRFLMGRLPWALARLFLSPSLPRCSPPVSFQRRPVSACCWHRLCFRCSLSFTEASATRWGRQPGWVLTASWCLCTLWDRPGLPSVPETRSGLLSPGRFGQECGCARWPARPRCNTRTLRLTGWFANGLPASNPQTSQLEFQHQCLARCNESSCLWLLSLRHYRIYWTLDKGIPFLSLYPRIHRCFQARGWPSVLSENRSMDLCQTQGILLYEATS